MKTPQTKPASTPKQNYLQKFAFFSCALSAAKKNSGFPCVFFVFHHQLFFFVFFLYFPPLFSLGAFSSLFSC
jgi:hypothetical protein